MTFTLWMSDGTRLTNITPIVGKLSWQSSVSELGQKLDVEVAYSDMPFMPQNPLDVGHLLILKKDQEEVLRTIIVDENRNGRDPIGYTSFDAAFYLNKSKTIYQFNGTAASKAISKVLNDFGVPIGSVVSIPTVIDDIYNKKSPASIIKDILTQAEKDQGTKYRMEMRQGKLYVEKQSDLVVEATFDLAENITGFPAEKGIADPSRKRSIDKMRNSIKAVKEDKVVLTLEDEGAINTYGLLQDLEDVKELNDAQIRNVANNRLKELAKVFEENSLSIIGDHRVRAGRIMNLEEPVTGMSGQYLVQSVTHNVSNGIHTMSLDVEGLDG